MVVDDNVRRLVHPLFDARGKGTELYGLESGFEPRSREPPEGRTPDGELRMQGPGHGERMTSSQRPVLEPEPLPDPIVIQREERKEPMAEVRVVVRQGEPRKVEAGIVDKKGEADRVALLFTITGTELE